LLFGLAPLAALLVAALPHAALAQVVTEPAPAGSDAAPPAPQRPPSQLIARESAETIASDDGDEAGFLSVAPMQIAGARGRRFTGRRIDIDLRDADIHNVLRLLAEVGGVNIVTSDDVSGTVTIRMRNVPWDQALDVILAARSLGMQRQGNIIRVAPQATLDKEREMQIERLRQQQTLEPLETRLIPVSYALATEIAPRGRELLSSRGSISVDERTNVLIARDVAANLNQIERLVRSLDTQTPQVLVEARIVEATSTYLRDVGIQWGGDGSASTATGNPTGLVFPSSIGIVGGATDLVTNSTGLSPISRSVNNPNFAVNLPATVGAGQGGAIGLTFGSINGNVNINVRLSAAESNGQLRIVSSPRILTLDNREALIAQGTLIPYSQISAQGVQTAFQEAKLQLRVRPHVTADGSVAMHVRITRDEPDFNNTGARGDPTILKREAETDLLIPDGRTAVIGGIYTRNTGRNVDQVPFFGDIPILGVLFQRRRNSDRRTEMLIFLTPRIVNRAEALGR
jgi:type IV pilus assembly protein PilQ